MRENGTLQGQTDSMPTQTAVALTKIRFPLTVQMPPHLELLFQSQTRRYDSITPAMITSNVGSHEHFLQRLLTKSGTQKNRGEESYPAQSLQESGNVKCKMTAKMVVFVTMMIIEKKACFKELKWKSLMLPTQMQPAIKQQQTQFSTKKAITVTNIVRLKLMRSQILIILNTGFLNLFTRNTTSLKQMKTKKKEIMIPEYLIATKAMFLSLAENRVKAIIATLPITLNIRKGIHFSQKRSGLRLILIDQICECMATPTMMAALMKEMSMQPIQNCLYLPSGSQLSRKLKILFYQSMKDTQLKQLQRVYD